MHENRSLYPVAQALLAAMLFGASAPISKALLGDVEPIPLAAFLYLGSGISALLLLWLQRPKDGVAKEASISRADLPWLAGAVFFGGVAAPILLMFSLRETPAASAALLLNFESIATTAIAWAVFHEAVGRRAWGGVLLITLSSIVLSWQADGQWGLSIGALGIIAACTLWGVDNNLTRKISAKNPLTIVMLKGLGAGSCSLVLAFVAGQAMPAAFHAISAMLLGSLSYGLSITLFILAMRDLGAARTSALFSTSPFIGSLLAFLLFREAPTVQFILTFAIMCGGTWLLAEEKHCPGTPIRRWSTTTGTGTTTAITPTPICPARFRPMATTHIRTSMRPWSIPIPIHRTSTTSIDNSLSHVTIEHKFYSLKRRVCNDLRM